MGEFGTRLGEGLLGGVAHQLGLLVQVGEEQIQFGLHALGHATEHARNQRRQRQLAPARKGARMIGMARQLMELWGMQVLDEIGE